MRQESLDVSSRPASSASHTSLSLPPSLFDSLIVQLFIIRKALHAACLLFIIPLGQSETLIGHRRRMDVLRSVRARDGSGPVPTARFPQWRKRLGDHGPGPILQRRAVACRSRGGWPKEIVPFDHRSRFRWRKNSRMRLNTERSGS